MDWFKVFLPKFLIMNTIVLPAIKESDEAKNEPFLGGHLSPNSNLFDQILPKIVHFVILGTFGVKFKKESILDVFGA